jgi:hypothetical protein
MNEEILPGVVGSNEPKPLSTLNHLTVPVAIADTSADWVPRTRKLGGKTAGAGTALPSLGST